MSTDIPVAATRSTFVTVTAWSFIVLSAFATFTAVVQNLMVTMMFSTEEIVQAVNREPDVPAVMALVFRHLKLILILFLGLCVATLVSSIGLLRRRDWARQLFIAMLVLGMVWMIAGFGLQYFALSSVNAIPGVAGAAAEAQFGAMMMVMAVMSALISLTFIGLFGWIIKRLLSPEVRREFAGP